MITTSAIKFKDNIDKYFRKISDDFETVFISNDNEKDLVLISLDEYNSLVATKYELSSEKNKDRLDSAIKKINNGNSFEKELIEV
jgi:antitoxin YefM